ncbi:MAG: DUF2490 domain-containing protein [Bacteroidota bacterium]
MRTLIVCLFLLVSIQSFAQKWANHQVFWGRLILSDTINSRLRWEMFIQKRTQNDYAGDANVFHSDQFDSYWFWLNYSVNKNLRVSISPFGYFKSYVLNVQPGDADLAPVKEWRWCARVEQGTNGKYLNFANRWTAEYRYRDLKNNDDWQPNWRLRYMMRFDKPVKGLLSDSKPVTFTISNEIFLQAGKSVHGNPNIFDQNRLYGGAAYEILKNVKLSVGYIYGFQERVSGKDFDHINYYWVVLTFDNLISQFRHQKNIFGKS